MTLNLNKYIKPKKISDTLYKINLSNHIKEYSVPEEYLDKHGTIFVYLYTYPINGEGRSKIKLVENVDYSLKSDRLIYLRNINQNDELRIFNSLIV